MKTAHPMGIDSDQDVIDYLERLNAGNREDIACSDPFVRRIAKVLKARNLIK